MADKKDGDISVRPGNAYPPVPGVPSSETSFPFHLFLSVRLSHVSSFASCLLVSEQMLAVFHLRRQKYLISGV